MSYKILVVAAMVCTARCGLLEGGVGGLTKSVPVGGKHLKMLNKPLKTVDGAAAGVPQAGGIDKNIGGAMENAQDIQKAAAPVGLDLSGDKLKIKNKGKGAPPKKGKKTTTTTPEPEEEEEEKQDEDDD